jgi:putative acetyltransferase
VSPRIRPFVPEDAPALAELTVAAIAMIGLRAYSIEQVLAWAAHHPSPARFLEGAEAGELILVALADEGAPAAYAILHPQGHLDMLYCHPDHAGKGLASAPFGSDRQRGPRARPHAYHHARQRIGDLEELAVSGLTLARRG